MSRPGQALRAHMTIMARPFVPRTLEQEERAGYEATRTMRSLPQEHKDSLIATFELETRDADPVRAARARGFLRGLEA